MLYAFYPIFTLSSPISMEPAIRHTHIHRPSHSSGVRQEVSSSVLVAGCYRRKPKKLNSRSILSLRQNCDAWRILTNDLDWNSLKLDWLNFASFSERDRRSLPDPKVEAPRTFDPISEPHHCMLLRCDMSMPSQANMLLNLLKYDMNLEDVGAFACIYYNFDW